jgi:preprotein translocase subunit SecD
MGKSLRNRIVFIIVVLLVSVFGIIGIPHGGLKQSIANRINLGLDLRGGTHLVLEVKVAEAVAHQTDKDVQQLQDDLSKAGLTGAVVTKNDPAHEDQIQIAGIPPARLSDVRGLLGGVNYSTYDVNTNPDGSLKLSLKQASVRDIETRALDQSIETIRDRIDKLGVSEPVIEKYGLGDNEILVELPGVEDPGHVQDIIQSTARLEIHEVAGGPYATDQDALTANPGGVPADSILLHGSGSAAGGDEVWLLKRLPVVAGTDFRDAQPSEDENGRPDMTFNLTTTAGDQFYKFTDAHKGTGSMAIVLNNQVREVAGIQGAIRDSGRITGGFTREQANDLSMMLRTGALPASITYLETRTVGASLGAASIRQGVEAAIAGMVAVMIFLLVYYRGAGINADLALILNLLILLGFMGYSHSTLTLPGIAGVILTIGMGVDSNVLIFERIREELRAGKTAAGAVKQGFESAWVTILDTHVTTIVSAAILFLFGTGPIKGFAVTLTFGLLANLFTAVLVSRVIFDAVLRNKDRSAALSI